MTECAHLPGRRIDQPDRTGVNLPDFAREGRDAAPAVAGLAVRHAIAAGRPGGVPGRVRQACQQPRLPAVDHVLDVDLLVLLARLWPSFTREDDAAAVGCPGRRQPLLAHLLPDLPFRRYQPGAVVGGGNQQPVSIGRETHRPPNRDEKRGVAEHAVQAGIEKDALPTVRQVVQDQRAIPARQQHGVCGRWPGRDAEHLSRWERGGWRGRRRGSQRQRGPSTHRGRCSR